MDGYAVAINHSAPQPSYEADACLDAGGPPCISKLIKYIFSLGTRRGRVMADLFAVESAL